MAALRHDQVRRYARHILLPDVGGTGQARFLASEVAVEVHARSAAEVVALAYLAAAGVGRLCITGAPHGLVTADEARSGILYGTADIGRPRIDALRERIAELNPDVEVVAHDGVPGTAAQRAVPLAPPVIDPWDSWRTGPAVNQPGQPDDISAHDAVAAALVAGGARAVKTLMLLASHEPA